MRTQLRFTSDTNESNFIDWMSEHYPETIMHMQREGPLLVCSIALQEDAIAEAWASGAIVEDCKKG